MKKVFLLLFIVSAFIACQENVKEEVFLIKGKIEGVENGKVFLEAKKIGLKQNAKIENGEFVLKGHVDEPCFCELTIDGVADAKNFCLENSNIEIEANVDFLSDAIIKGSTMDSEREEYRSILKALKVKYKYDEIESEWDVATEERKVELDSIFEAYDKELWETKMQFVIDNPASYYSTIILWDIDWMFKSADEFDEFIKQLDPSLNGYGYYEEVKENFNRLRAVEVGQTAPDFTMNDIVGNPISMSEILKQSKYLLIEFWSSNCGSCRVENKKLVRAYKKFHQKGFNILGISTDTKKENWLKAVKDDSLTWANVCNFKKWDENEIIKLLALRQSNENLLLDSSGKIILRNIKGDKLQEKIEELMN